MFVKRKLPLSILACLAILVSLSSDGLVEGAKHPCKTCKEFVVSFEKVRYSLKKFKPSAASGEKSL